MVKTDTLNIVNPPLRDCDEQYGITVRLVKRTKSTHFIIESVLK
jgi:hypothetical protein